MPENPRLLILNQMAGPMTWELAEDAGKGLGCVAVLTGHPDTLQKGSTEQVLLFPAAAYSRGTFARRAVSWLRYCWQAFFWLWRWPSGTPVLFFSNPPMVFWLGGLFKWLRKQPYVVMVHDIYPDILTSLGGMREKSWLIRLWRTANRLAYENADAVLTLGEQMAANLNVHFNTGKLKAGKVEVVYPWADTQNLRPMTKTANWFAQQHEQGDKLTVMYSGNMGLGHDIESMVAAARCLQAQPEIHFMLIGAGPKWLVLEKLLQHEPFTNLTLLPWQPEPVIPYSLAAADITLVSLEKEVSGFAIPSKAVYALAAGSAVIAIAAPQGELSAFIETYECGVRVDPGDSDGLTQAILSLHQDRDRLERCKRNARRASEEQFCRQANSALILQKVVFGQE